MSRENLELVQRGRRCFNRRDLDAFLALMDEEAEVRSLSGGSYGD
jgi:hypothetical protein